MADRASSFGAAAATYAALRPDYPVGAVRWAVEGVEPLAHVVDLGAGTGKLTAVLLAALPGVEVTAVEPDAGMLAALDLPVAKLAASAEATTLPAASADVVAVGQAWHWFDRDRAPVEVARVLRPGGRLAIVANLHDGSDPRHLALFMAMGADESTVTGDAELVWKIPGFPKLESRRFAHEQRVTLEGAVRLVHSYSQWLVSTPEEQAATDSRVRELAEPLLDDDGLLRIPYRTYAWRTTRP